jgi:alpha-beta hydrolase superfamily lysophospholipase
MSQRFEGLFKGVDQTELFFQTWVPEKVRGTILITHGLAEHSECYHHVAKTLAEDGWRVFAWDLRGHGRSEGKRGFVKHLSFYMDDLEIFHKLVLKESDGAAPIMFAHSMGGLITTRFLQTRPVKYSALVLSSPLFGISAKVPWIKETLAHVAVKWLPTLTMHNEIKYEDLTRDEEFLKAYPSDVLRHDKISPGLFLSMVESFPLAFENAERIQNPVLMQISGEDRIVSSQASREMFEKFPNKKNQMIVYNESLHEIYNDIERETVLSDLKRFINPYLGANS